jgi:hypothetical protein
MNPYLEQEEVWHDFHQSFVPLAREMLAAQVRPAYVVKIEEYLFIHELSAEERIVLGRSDAGIKDSAIPNTQTRTASGAATAPYYARVPQAVDTERHSYLEIRDRHGRELIAVIELLSPANKRIGADREMYVSKRRQLLASGVHLVEIDLLRGGPRMPMEDLPDCDYYAIVSRVEDRPRVGVWPIRLREPLPKIPIPLRGDDPDAKLDLQAALHRIYDAAGYQDYIYLGRPQPPLHPADADWAQQFLPASR